MKLQKFAITALALSMSAAFAGGDKYHDKEKRVSAEAGSSTQLSVTTPAQPGAPAGYADKAETAAMTTGQSDTAKDQAATQATVVAPAAIASSGTSGAAPAGYADKAESAAMTTGQSDTAKDQAATQATLVAPAAIESSGTHGAAPAGYSDKSAAATDKKGQKDTQSGQQR